MKKAVVIGGSGFVGSHVADFLSQEGFHVVIYDIKESNWLREDQEMVVGSVLDEALKITLEGAEVVYNFAAIADIEEALSKPKDSAEVNILGNLNVLEACRLNSVKRFIYASTVYVHSR